MALRVVSYNIRAGGTGRMPAIAAVLGRLQPDAVALLEADDQSLADWLGVSSACS